MTLSQINTVALAQGLVINGAFHPEISDNIAAKTLILLGPSQGFWDIFSTSPEYNDRKDNPLDRWSMRIITAIAQEFNATPQFPFGGPPYAPFLSWAIESQRAWPSPIGMLVHDNQGLMVSYRGALLLDHPLPLPTPPSASPCGTCDAQPCTSACPVDAFAQGGYDVARCRTYLHSPEGQTCLEGGCLARRACPISKPKSRPKGHNLLHMIPFKENT
ncbi:hypothetical protein GCM10007939_13070 [Amylibacter marinus]|uniref:4Fe-4S ferredoxin-type domain-containing protein n=1 Tax=Amylibacter marinus TaxID=1475483 RepID=A0ABQ5VV36_9RHOB|nr:ferredoxin [Amylibacter marinus]GLQ35024.1 hypothetical protein GCM10007939_13070 [Amylibacter marinus]